MSLHSSAIIHPTAIIDPGAVLGAGRSIWHWAHVCPGARIGAGCSLGQNVYVGGNACIANGIRVQDNVSIYENVTLEGQVFCGLSVVLTNIYNPRAAVSREHELRDLRVHHGARLGTNCTTVCGCEIGSDAFIGAGAVFTRDVKPFPLMVGVHARQMGWRSTHGDRIPLPLDGAREWICPHRHDRYGLQGDVLSRTPAGPSH